MANDCSQIIRLVEDYKSTSKDERNSKIINKIGQLVGKQALKIGIKVATKSVGAATGVGILFDLLKPSKIATGSGRYHDHLKSILKELDSENINIDLLKKEYSLLLDAKKQLMIEKDFGTNTNCYKAIDTITNEIGEIIKSFHSKSNRLA